MPEDHNLNIPHHENFTSQSKMVLLWFYFLKGRSRNSCNKKGRRNV